MSILRIYSLLASSFLLMAKDAEGVSVVERGVAKSAIVLPSDAPKCCVMAAKEFVRWTEELTGAKIPVGPEKMCV